jgi:peptidoglycan/LPS O-acetylase OafA/YrhL
MGHARFANLWPSATTNIDFYNAVFYWHNHAVDIFFTLSGFILFHVHPPDKLPEWRRYFVARAARIYPLYIATTGIALVLFQLGASIEFWPIQGVSERLMVAMNFLGIQQWNLVGGPNNSLNFPAWSISVELLLYITMYPVFRAVFRLVNIPPRMALLFSGLALALNSCYHLGIETISGPALILRGISGFAAGAFLFRAINGGRVCKYSTEWFAVSVALFGATASNIIPRELLPLMALPLLYQLSVLKLTSGKIMNFCRWCGDSSYGVYLVHVPAMKLILFVLAVWGIDTNGIFAASNVFKIMYIIITVFTVFGAARLANMFVEKPGQLLIKRCLL